MSAGIENYMATDLVVFGPDDDIIQAMRVLVERHLSGAPVLNASGQVIGMLSQTDCFAIMYKTAYHQDWGGKVEQYMSRKVDAIDADITILEAAERFLHSNYRRFPVLRAGRLVGQISRRDIMLALDDHYLRAKS